MEKHRYGLRVLNQLIVRGLLCRLKHNDFVINWWLSIKLESSTERENDRQFFYSNYLERHKICHAWFFGSKKRYGLSFFLFGVNDNCYDQCFLLTSPCSEKEKWFIVFFQVYSSWCAGHVGKITKLDSECANVDFLLSIIFKSSESSPSNPSLISRFQLASDATSESNE